MFVRRLSSVAATAALLALVPAAATAKPLAPLLPLHGETPAPAAEAQEPPATAAAEHAPGGVKLDWVRLPGGQFGMGSDFTRKVDVPGRLVQVAAFEIARTEVTVAQYQACVEAGACAARETVDWAGITPADAAFWSAACNADAPGHGDHPMNCVSAHDAEKFCAWAGGRLPSAKEWEFAARGAEERTFPWGDEAPDATRVNTCGEACLALGTAWRKGGFRVMNGAENHFTTTSPVGAFPAGRTPEGVADLAGNVWEWMAGPADARAADTRRAHRGGGWWTNDPARLASANAMTHAPTHRSANLGFRCAK